MLKDFKAFVLRGNVIDLAIGVVIGAAFGAVVTSLVTDLMTPLVALFWDESSLSDWDVNVGSATLYPGRFLNALISFLTISFVVFFFIVRPVNHLMERRKTEPDVESTTRNCPECLSSIPTGARRCAFCTAEVASA